MVDLSDTDCLTRLSGQFIVPATETLTGGIHAFVPLARDCHTDPLGLLVRMGAHPNKPSSEYITDYNKCQSLVARDPKLQQGSQLMILNATERCVQKEGWRLVEQ